MYLESGEEVIVGSLNGGPVGTFTTTYRFESKWDPDPSGVELHGRCQHPIVKGSGTGGFEGASGRLDFKDIVDAGPSSTEAISASANTAANVGTRVPGRLPGGHARACARLRAYLGRRRREQTSVASVACIGELCRRVPNFAT